MKYKTMALSGVHEVVVGSGAAGMSACLLTALALAISAAPLPANEAHGTLDDGVGRVATPEIITAQAELGGPARRPNIILIFSDDHALRAVSAYGDALIETPGIDRIADEGMLFRHATVTNSICGPSRAALLTGKFSHLNGIFANGERFDGSQPTLPKYLQAHGYETAIIGKWHLGSEPTGFDHWDVLPGQGSYFQPTFISERGKTVYGGYVTDVIGRKTIDWLEHQRSGDRPFFLMSQHKAPHRGWMPPVRHLNLYVDEDFPEPDTLFDTYEGRASGAARQEMTLARHFTFVDLKIMPDANDLAVRADRTPAENGWRRALARLTPEQRQAYREALAERNRPFAGLSRDSDDWVRYTYQRYMQDYLAVITAMDENIARLLDHLDSSGLAENTIVIYTSDQGFYLGEHGWYDKRWMYEESLHTPLVIRWPGVTPQGSETGALIQNIDIAPTLLEAAGVPVPDDMQGESFVPFLRGEEPDGWRDAIYYHYYEGPPAVHAVARHYGVRSERYKLIHYYDLDEWELFDLERDPNEMQSVYGDPGYVDVQAEMLERLRELREQYGDT